MHLYVTNSGSCLSVWMFGCLAAPIWLFDCLAVWLFDCLTVWLFDCFAAPVCLFGSSCLAAPILPTWQLSMMLGQASPVAHLGAGVRQGRQLQGRGEGNYREGRNRHRQRIHQSENAIWKIYKLSKRGSTTDNIPFYSTPLENQPLCQVVNTYYD